jgi:hypothetical protein
MVRGLTGCLHSIHRGFAGFHRFSMLARNVPPKFIQHLQSNLQVLLFEGFLLAPSL